VGALAGFGGGGSYVLRPLTIEEEDLVRAALAPGNEQEMLADEYNIPVTREKMKCLCNGQWLNDEVINFFMNMLGARGVSDATLPKCHFMNSMFYAKLAEAPSYKYASVKRWTKKANLFVKDFVVIPVHVHGNHWTLALINFKERRFEYYDSLFGHPGRTLVNLRQYMHDESHDKRKLPFDDTGWSDLVHHDGPKQRNGSDCGVFMCTSADYISRGVPLDFRQEDMPYLRNRMVLQIMRNALLE